MRLSASIVSNLITRAAIVSCNAVSDFVVSPTGNFLGALAFCNKLLSWICDKEARDRRGR